MECILWRESQVDGVPIASAPGSGAQPGAFDHEVEPGNTTGTTLPRPAIDTVSFALPSYFQSLTDVNSSCRRLHL
jgi:hypothetical protein